MLKDLIKKTIRKNEDKLRFPIADGFVEITGYDKNGDVFYHDYGDNVVTDWMRHAIMSLLCGVAYTKMGGIPDWSGHKETDNPDAYIENGEQFFKSHKNANDIKYCESTIPENNKALFPTKILLGTGKEYSSWEQLSSENKEAHSDWYNKMVELFGKSEELNEAKAKENFEKNISKAEDPEYNVLSGTITNGVTSGDGEIQKCRSVNDPEYEKSNVASSTSMYKNYNVIGAVKTACTQSEDPDKFMDIVTDSGKLLKPEWRGVGKPCFIYFKQGNGKNETWNADASDIRIYYNESADKYLTKISFTVILPAQTSAEDAEGAYYPYNGFQLKQIGLYNDSRLMIEPNAVPTSPSESNYYSYTNMPYGMLLAVKNITPVIKAADASYKLKWTLTI